MTELTDEPTLCNPIPFLRKGSRDELKQATGDTMLPAMKLPDGSV